MARQPKNIIGVIGDLHMRDFLAYADYLYDKRIEERKEILDFIVKSFDDCNHIVFIGDNFHSKNNSSETNRQFIEFIERFGSKEIYLISGNHEKKGDGKTAIDFIGEIDKKNWHVFTKPIDMLIDSFKVSFLPYMLPSELDVEDNEQVTREIIKRLKGGDILFAHHAITGTTFNGINVEMFLEPILPKEQLESLYKKVIAGHIHSPLDYGNTVITGSVFNQEVGEDGKYIFKINSELEIEKIKLPGRAIYKIENPTEEKINSISSNSIVKAVVTDKNIDTEVLQKQLSKFDASLLIENYPNQRKKSNIKNEAFDFSLEALLKLYAEEKDVDYQKLLKGLELIK